MVTTLADMLPGFILNLVVAVLVIGFTYYPPRRSKPEYVFTFFIFNILIYFIAGLLRDVQLTLGMGFGMLAVFSVLRFQADRSPIREMTFLFISISIPFINQLFLSTRISFNELIVINAIIVIAVYVLDRGWGVRYLGERLVLYEKIELIRPEYQDELMADLRDRTGLSIRYFEVMEINFMRDVATIMIYYDVPR